MEESAGQEEEEAARGTKCLHGEATPDVTSLPNDDLGALPSSALQGPATQAHREEMAKTVFLSLIGFAARTTRRSTRTQDHAAVAAMQGASVAAALPLLGTHHHEVAVEVAVATMKGATPGQPR